MPILIIVESPAKVKKIQGYLGSDYLVTSSMGHVTEIPQTTLGIDLKTYIPEFIETPSKKDVISNIKKLYKTCNGVLMASDNDREGCGISWHIFNILGVKPENRKRILFNEITEIALQEAIKIPVLIDENEKDSYLGRVVLDKLIGYTISPLLWKEFNAYNLSAGRVMSPVIRLIIERENEIAKFQSSSYFKLDANFVLDKKDLKLSVKKNIIHTICDEDIKHKSTIEKLYKDMAEDKIKFTIKCLTKNNSTRSPPPPFITSSLQQASSISLGISPNQTMKLAQDLYSHSVITYMRSDSTAIAEDAMKSIKTQIESKFGEKYYKRTVYKSKNNSAQNAHECIRPTNCNIESIMNVEGLTGQHDRLYKLIWRRILCSQMSPASLEIRTVKISTGEKKKDQLIFNGKHEKIIFDGFLKVQNIHKKQKFLNSENHEENNEENNEDKNDDDENEEENENNEVKTANEEHNKYLETVFDKLKEGEPAFVTNMNCNEKYSKPKQSRYTEASLVSVMEKLNIGRPSTFSNTISKIQDKDYIERKSLPTKKVNLTILNYTYPNIIKIDTKEGKIEGDKNKLIPTSLALMVNEFLCKNFSEIMSYEFTSHIESLLDDIANNKAKLYDVIHSIYTKLTPIIDELAKNIKLRKELKSADPNADTASRRNLGMNPITNLPIVAIKSKKGFLIIEENPVKKEARFANFSSSFEDMTLEKALSLLIFPKNLGIYNEKSIMIKKAKNIYIQYGDASYSIENYMTANPKLILDPETITISEAQKVIEYYVKSKADKAENDKKDKKLSDDITIKTGPYGVYLKLANNTNVKLPKKYKDNIDSLTLEEAIAIVDKNANTPSKGSKAGKFGSQRKGKAKEPKAKESKAKEPKAKEPKAKEPKAKESKAKESKAKEPKAKEPKAKESKATKESKAMKESKATKESKAMKESKATIKD